MGELPVFGQEIGLFDQHIPKLIHASIDKSFVNDIIKVLMIAIGKINLSHLSAHSIRA
jgi:hypothetical protein